jgi:sulfur carrier protein ThiS
VDLHEANEVLRYADWSNLLTANDGETFAVKVNGEAVLATKVSSNEKEDYDYDRRLSVVVEVQGQFFKKTGYAQNGSHCYGDYEPSWDEMTEVFPHLTTVTTYKSV